VFKGLTAFGGTLRQCSSHTFGERSS